MGSEQQPSDRPHRIFREAEESFRLLVERVEDYAIFMLDPRGHVISWNLGAQRIKGYRADEIVGKHYALFFTPDDVGKGIPEWMLNVASAEGHCEIQGWRVRKDGTRFWADIVVTALRDEEGNLQGFAKITRDTTKKKLEEQRFQMAVEAAPNAMIMVNPKGRIELVNAQTEKLFGYRREELLGRSIEILVPERFRGHHPQFRADFFHDPRARAMGAGRELFGLRKDGKEFPVEIGLNPIHTIEGPFVMAAIVDITERKRSEERFRLAVESAPNPMIMADRGGKIVLVNAQVERLLGYSRAELIGQPVEILVPERLRSGHAGERAAFMHRPTMRPMGAGRDLFARRKDGVEVPVEIGLNPIQTAEGQFVLASMTDLTERKRAEENQKFLVEATSVLSSSLDPTVSLSGVARLISPRLADLCLIDFRDPRGTVVRAAAVHRDPDVQARFQGLVPPQAVPRERIELRSASRPEELTRVAPDAEHLALLREIGVRSAVLAPLQSGDRALGAILLASGRSGPADLALIEELARRVSMAIENSRHYREAHEAVRTREEFLSIASHELKTPLTTLQLQLQVIQRQLARKGDGEAELQEGIEVLRGQVRRLTVLINTLLDVSRITAGKLKLSPVEVDFSEIVREVVKRHQEEIEQKGIRVDLRIPESVVGFWDRLRLDQLVTNLLTNALKYGERKPVTVTLEQEREEARLAVQDSGVGIRPEDQTRIFQPFERAASPWHASGLGMGLYIVRQVVEAHGGRIAVKSSPGLGSTFVVELPLRRLAPAEVAGP